jgi:hypothetical protein
VGGDGGGDGEYEEEDERVVTHFGEMGSGSEREEGERYRLSE